MGYRTADISDLELYRGTLRRIRRALDITGFGINLHEMAPNATDYPEHAEVETQQQELYLCLSGGGTITVDGDEVELRPGRCVLVEPQSRRKIIAGADGLFCLAIGGRVGSHSGWENL